MQLKILKGVAKFDLFKEDARRAIESELDTLANTEGSSFTVTEISTLYKVRGAVILEKADKDIAVEIKVKSKSADNFTVFLIALAFIGLFTIVGAILFPLILWYFEESERKKAESVMGRNLILAVTRAAEKNKLEVQR